MSIIQSFNECKGNNSDKGKKYDPITFEKLNSEITTVIKIGNNCYNVNTLKDIVEHNPVTAGWIDDLDENEFVAHARGHLIDFFGTNALPDEVIRFIYQIKSDAVHGSTRIEDIRARKIARKIASEREMYGRGEREREIKRKMHDGGGILKSEFNRKHKHKSRKHKHKSRKHKHKSRKLKHKSRKHKHKKM